MRFYFQLFGFRIFFYNVLPLAKDFVASSGFLTAYSYWISIYKKNNKNLHTHTDKQNNRQRRTKMMEHNLTKVSHSQTQFLNYWNNWFLLFILYIWNTWQKWWWTFIIFNATVGNLYNSLYSTSSRFKHFANKIYYYVFRF